MSQITVPHLMFPRGRRSYLLYLVISIDEDNNRVCINYKGALFQEVCVLVKTAPILDKTILLKLNTKLCLVISREKSNQWPVFSRIFRKIHRKNIKKLANFFRPAHPDHPQPNWLSDRLKKLDHYPDVSIATKVYKRIFLVYSLYSKWQLDLSYR